MSVPGLGRAKSGERRAYLALAETFRAEGTSAIFSIIGRGNRHFLAEAARLNIRVITARHEGAALAMADGYARAGGAVGVASVEHGAGVAQLTTSMMVARKHGTPIVVLAGGIPLRMRHFGGELQCDERAMLEAGGARVLELYDPDLAAETARRAFHLARRTSGPVVLLAPYDLQDEPVRDGADPSLSEPEIASGRRGSWEAPRTMPVDGDIARATELLAAARRPVILGGHGMVAADAVSAAAQLADRLDAVLATTFGAKGAFDGNPRSLGTAGGLSLPRDLDVLRRADCVLVLGASLNRHTTCDGGLFSDARVIQVDCDEDAFERSEGAVALRLLGDVGETVGKLGDGLADAAEPARWDADTFEQLRERDSRDLAIAAEPAQLEPGTVDPRGFMLEMDRELPPDALVVVGGGHFMGFPMQYLRRGADRSFVLPFDFMTIGQGIATAIGAAVACPDRPVVAVEGDASAMMHIQELETAARNGIELLVFVMNDGALGAEYHGLVADGMQAGVALAPTPHLASVAEALGGAGLEITDATDASKIMSWYRSGRGPHLVDVRIPLNMSGGV